MGIATSRRGLSGRNASNWVLHIQFEPSRTRGIAVRRPVRWRRRSLRPLDRPPTLPGQRPFAPLAAPSLAAEPFGANTAEPMPILAVERRFYSPSGRLTNRDVVSSRIAFRQGNGDSTQNEFTIAAQGLADAYPCRSFVNISSRMPTHGSGPICFAVPQLQRTFTAIS